MEVTKPSGDEARESLLALYPELRHFTLSEILHQELHAEPSLSVNGIDQKSTSLWINITGLQRHSQVFLAAQERCIMADLWENGVLIGNASSDSFAEMGKFWRAALLQNLSLDEIEALAPCFRASEAGRAQEQGAQTYVNDAWKKLLMRLESEPTHSLALAASQIPMLRQLLPYTSLGRLCFSRCTGYPFSYDCPCAAFVKNDKRFAVLKAHGYRGGFNSEPLGFGNAQEAAQMLADALPSNCGPAILGTADDL